MKKALIKDTFKEIKNTFKRFMSILLIVLLGVGFFVGIKATSPDMKKSIDKYFDNQNVMDLQVISTLGLTSKDFNELKSIPGVSKVEGTFESDVLVNANDKDFVMKLSRCQSEINKLFLKEGKLPQNINECVVEKAFLDNSGYKIGDVVKVIAEDITTDNGEKHKLLKNNEFKIVGVVQSPLYISIERGNSKLGSGKVDFYMFIPEENFDIELYSNIYIKVDGANSLPCYSKEYKDKVKKVKNEIEVIQAERKEARYNEVYGKASSKIKDAEKRLLDEKSNAVEEIKKAEDIINKAKEEIEKGKIELENQKNNATSGFEEAKVQIENAEKLLAENEMEFRSKKSEAEFKINEAETNLVRLKGISKNYNKLNSDLTSMRNDIKEIKDKISSLKIKDNFDQIKELNMQLIEINKQILILQAKLMQMESMLEMQGLSIAELPATIMALENTISSSKNQILNAQNKLNYAKRELNNKKQEFENMKKTVKQKMEQAELRIQQADEEIQKNEVKLENAKSSFKNKIADAESKLEDAKLELRKIKKPEWYILDRNQNIGYASYLQDTDRISNIAKVFPIIFFVVAALISLTTMTRMVEEQRVQIGTLKALGYKKRQIASKYIVYAFLATVIGSGIGMLIGFNLIPKIILNMYAMMYTLPEIVIEFNMKYAIIGLLVALACTVGATKYSCSKTLKSMPSDLMRPKAPLPGKRVLLERIPFIWNNLNFTKKVTARNIFRYKKRFLMTIIGVCGCTSLIIAGFGLKDAVATMIPSQYGEIFNYTMEIALKDNLKKSKIDELYDKIINKNPNTKIFKVDKEAIEVVNIDNNQSIQLIVPEDIYEIDNFIKLRDIKDKNETYRLNDEGVIINNKLAEILNIKKGDTITLKNINGEKVAVEVSELTENYIFHYIYMSPTLYERLYKTDVIYNNFLVKTDLSLDEEEALGKQLLKEDKDIIAGVSFMSMVIKVFNEVMENMNAVVLILIVSAGLLCFVVLYNLSNTNISERVRELATIKVLGFYDKEVYNYVSKETVILTIIGILFGILGGTVLTTFIIKTCELDMFMFNPNIKIETFAYGILITTIFAAIVNISTYFALKKINMIDSLKSVE